MALQDGIGLKGVAIFLRGRNRAQSRHGIDVDLMLFGGLAEVGQLAGASCRYEETQGHVASVTGSAVERRPEANLTAGIGAWALPVYVCSHAPCSCCRRVVPADGLCPTLIIGTVDRDRRDTVIPASWKRSVGSLKRLRSFTSWRMRLFTPLNSESLKIRTSAPWNKRMEVIRSLKPGGIEDQFSPRLRQKYSPLKLRSL